MSTRVERQKILILLCEQLKQPFIDDPKSHGAILNAAAAGGIGLPIKQEDPLGAISGSSSGGSGSSTGHLGTAPTKAGAPQSSSLGINRAQSLILGCRGAKKGNLSMKIEYDTEALVTFVLLGEDDQDC